MTATSDTSRSTQRHGEKQSVREVSDGQTELLEEMSPKQSPEESCSCYP